MTVHSFSPSIVSSVSSGQTAKQADAFVPQQVVFCDFDGPIVDVSERYYQTYCAGLRAIVGVVERSHPNTNHPDLKIQPLSKSQFWQMKQNRIADIEIAIRSGLPAELFSSFMQQVERLVNHQSLLQWDCLQPAAVKALRYFQQHQMRLVLVTLRHPRQVQAILQAHGLTSLVHEIYGALDANAAFANCVEQKRELLRQAIAQQKAQGHLTQNSWMVGDTEADVLAGQSAGLYTAALSCGTRSEAYLQGLKPDKIYDCLMVAATELGKAPALLQAA